MEEPNLEIELLAAFKVCLTAGSAEECAKGELRAKHDNLVAQKGGDVLKRLKSRDWLVYG